MNFKIKNKADVSLTGNLNHFIEDLVKKIDEYLGDELGSFI